MTLEGIDAGSHKSGARWLGAAVLAISMMGTLQAQVAQAAAATPIPTATDAQLADARCVLGLEKFLPADYYYGLAAQTFGEHNDADAQRFFSYGRVLGQQAGAVRAVRHGA